MKTSAAIVAVLLALISLGCGGDDGAAGPGETESTTTAVSGETSPGTTTPAGAEEEQAPAPSDPGDSGFPAVSDPDDPRFASVSGGEGRRTQPRIEPSNQPPPKRLLVRDLKVGSGPVARPGDRAAVFYIGVDYKTGKRLFQTWPPTAQPFVVRLRPAGDAAAWEEGVMGMRVGGRREILVPSRLAFGDGALDYVLDLVRIEPDSQAPGTG